MGESALLLGTSRSLSLCGGRHVECCFATLKSEVRDSCSRHETKSGLNYISVIKLKVRSR
jgi:hypothetical protein